MKKRRRKSRGLLAFLLFCFVLATAVSLAFFALKDNGSEQNKTDIQEVFAAVKSPKT